MLYISIGNIPPEVALLVSDLPENAFISCPSCSEHDIRVRKLFRVKLKTRNEFSDIAVENVSVQLRVKPSTGIYNITHSLLCHS